MTSLGDVCVKNFEAFIRKNMYSDEDFKKFKKTLKEVGGIIAGGSVLAFCYGSAEPIYKTSDIDIYVNVEQSRPMMEFIFGNKTSFRSHQKAKFSTYDDSHLSRNKIRSIYEFCPYYNSVVNKKFKIELDIMTVRNSRTPQEVAQNFDLSCCQVWYDGNNIYAHSIEDVLSKTATMNREYIPAYLSGNIFLLKRKDKYQARGFTIAADIPEEFTIIDEPKFPFIKFRKMSMDRIEELYKSDDNKRLLVGKILCRIIHSDKNDEGYDSEEYDNPEKFCVFEPEVVKKATNDFKKNLAKSVSQGKSENIILLNDWFHKYWLNEAV